VLTRAVKFPVGFIANAASRSVEGHLCYLRLCRLNAGL